MNRIASSRREPFDIAVIGAGVVGCAAALAFARDGWRVALVEAQSPTSWRADAPDLRVYAFAPDNAALLDDLEVWRDVVSARVQPYRAMRVWDAAGGGELAFAAERLGRSELGWIVEHGLLVDRLWSAVQRAGVTIFCPQRITALAQDVDSATLTLEDHSSLRARLVIAADGPDSALRDLVGLTAPRHDYGQRAVVAYVETELPHQDTAWQRFLPGGPLAFLPCADTSGDARGNGHTSSIVWTVPDAEAQRLLELDDAAFRGELTRAFDATLGEVVAVGKRVAFPLRRQLAQDYAAGRLVLAGDAAHVVHPLAGQGVNLGLRDVAALRELVGSSARQSSGERNSGHDRRAARERTARHLSITPQRLARYARERKSENALAAYSFEGLNRLFSNDAPLPTLLRGRLLGLFGRITPLVDRLARRAAG
jgi:2-octaprenyl-3-methyl-6-methoxy-1,4-benzoquinol hydroxylase